MAKKRDGKRGGDEQVNELKTEVLMAKHSESDGVPKHTDGEDALVLPWQDATNDNATQSTDSGVRSENMATDPDSGLGNKRDTLISSGSASVAMKQSVNPEPFSDKRECVGGKRKVQEFKGNAKQNQGSASRRKEIHRPGPLVIPTKPNMRTLLQPNPMQNTSVPRVPRVPVDALEVERLKRQRQAPQQGTQSQQRLQQQQQLPPLQPNQTASEGAARNSRENEHASATPEVEQLTKQHQEVLQQVGVHQRWLMQLLRELQKQEVVQAARERMLQNQGNTQRNEGSSSNSSMVIRRPGSVLVSTRQNMGIEMQPNPTENASMAGISIGNVHAGPVFWQQQYLNPERRQQQFLGLQQQQEYLQQQQEQQQQQQGELQWQQQYLQQQNIYQIQLQEQLQRQQQHKQPQQEQLRRQQYLQQQQVQRLQQQEELQRQQQQFLQQLQFPAKACIGLRNTLGENSFLNSQTHEQQQQLQPQQQQQPRPQQQQQPHPQRQQQQPRPQQQQQLQPQWQQQQPRPQQQQQPRPQQQQQQQQPQQQQQQQQLQPQQQQQQQQQLQPQQQQQQPRRQQQQQPRPQQQQEQLRQQQQYLQRQQEQRLQRQQHDELQQQHQQYLQELLTSEQLPAMAGMGLQNILGEDSSQDSQTHEQEVEQSQPQQQQQTSLQVESGRVVAFNRLCKDRKGKKLTAEDFLACVNILFADQPGFFSTVAEAVRTGRL